MKVSIPKPSKRRFQTGTTAFVTIVVAVVLAVGANLLVNALPQSITKIDISKSELYTLGESTKTVVQGLVQPVHIYYLVQEGKQDVSVKTLLDRYTEQSKQIFWEIKDPAVYPTFAQNYNNAQEGSVIVTSGDKYQVLNIYDLYQYSYDPATGGYTTSFDAENQITSALRYVSQEKTPIVYQLKGHNELSLSFSITDRMKQQNLTTQDLNLLNLEAVPEDAAAVVMAEPQKDLTEHEAQLLRAYLNKGGNLLLFSGLTENELPNLNALLKEYGLSRSGGLVIETDESKIYGKFPNILLPNISQTRLMQGVDRDGYVILENCEGILVDEQTPENVMVTKLLTTSDQAVSKTNWKELSGWKKEEGDLEGQFSLGVWAEKNTEETTSNLVWFTSASLLNDKIDILVNGNNSAVVLSVTGQLAGQDMDSLGIAAKPVGMQYLVVPAEDAARWNLICMYLLPAAALIVGIVVTVKRRKA